MSGSRSFRVAATGARVISGAVLAAACVVGVVMAIGAPWPTIAHEPAQAEVTPLPGDTVLVCNGDFRAIGRNSSNPLQMVSAAAPEFTVDGSSGAPRTDELTATDLADAGEVRRLTGEVEERTAPLLGATESVTLAENDLSGLAAAPCREARTEGWLVGGSVATGAEDIIVLTNPGSVPSTVTLTVHGTVRGTRTVIVPPGAQLALPLTSIAARSEAPVVQVTAVGSPVRAVLQSSLTRTLDPVGVDLQDSVAGPQQHPLIAGVQVFQTAGDAVGTTLLRLLSPETDSEATVTLTPVGGGSAVSEFTVPLTEGLPAEVSLADIGPGTYNVQVDADAPVLAAARQQDGAGPGSDFAWITPAPLLDGDVLFAVPAGPAARLVLVNDADADTSVTLSALDGDEQQVTVPADGSAAVDLQVRTVYALSGAEEVHAVVTMSAAGALAAWPVWPAAGAEQSITVYH